MGSHRHQCPSCRTIWQHGDNCGGSDKAHRCPTCGSTQFTKYWGSHPPDRTTGSCASGAEIGLQDPRLAQQADALFEILFGKVEPSRWEHATGDMRDCLLD